MQAFVVASLVIILYCLVEITGDVQSLLVD